MSHWLLDWENGSVLRGRNGAENLRLEELRNEKFEPKEALSRKRILSFSEEVSGVSE